MKRQFLALLFTGLFASALASPAPRFNHVAILVTDLPASEAFYREVIGLQRVPDPFNDDRHAWFALAPKVTLHLIGGATERSPKSKQNHLCFSVASVDDFIARLAKAGVVHEDLLGRKSAVTLRPDGVKQIYLTDPDGYWIEINDAKE